MGMKKLIFFCTVFCTYSISYAQVEIPRSEPIRIEPERTESRNFNFNRERDQPLLKRPEAKPKISLIQSSDLLDPGERINRPKFRKDAPRPETVNNTFLGEVTTGSAFMKFICRDHMYQDGDRVRVIVDGVTQIEDIYLTNAWKGFEVRLSEGFNKIEIQALNQGASGPNTAQFKVYDDKEALLTENTWNLYTGITATLIVIRDSGPDQPSKPSSYNIAPKATETDSTRTPENND